MKFEWVEEPDRQANIDDERNDNSGDNSSDNSLTPEELSQVLSAETAQMNECLDLLTEIAEQTGHPQTATPEVPPGGSSQPETFQPARFRRSPPPPPHPER